MYKKICVSVIVVLLASKAVCAFETGTLRVESLVVLVNLLILQILLLYLMGQK